MFSSLAVQGHYLLVTLMYDLKLLLELLLLLGSSLYSLFTTCTYHTTEISYISSVALIKGRCIL